jgi:hypothetical protein
MYNDESPLRGESLMRVEPDERIGLMQAFVQADDKLRCLVEDRERIEKDLARTREQRADMVDRLASMLGLTETQSDLAIDALRERFSR